MASDAVVYVLCTHGGSDSYEPYVAVFSTLAAAKAHHAALPDEGRGGAWFIERHEVDQLRATYEDSGGES